MARLATRLMLGETIESLELKDKVIRVLTEFTSQTRKCTPLVLLCKTREATVRLRHSLELTRFWDLLKLSLWHSINLRKLLEVSCLMRLLPGKTKGTADFYNTNGIKCEVVNKIGGGRQDVVDMIRGLK